MHAIIIKENGGYYTSEVFADYYTAGLKYEEVHSDDLYLIVLNEEKTMLIKQPLYNKLSMCCIIVDTDKSGWNLDEHGFGEVGFMTRAELERCVENGELPERIAELDREYRYREIREITSEKDVKDFIEATGSLHDCYLSADVEQYNGGFYVVFDGCWGFKAELWFEGDAEYRLSDDFLTVYYWAGETKESCKRYSNEIFNCSVLIEDGFVWLFDDEVKDAADRQDCDLIMKARRVKYRIIPK